MGFPGVKKSHFYGFYAVFWAHLVSEFLTRQEYDSMPYLAKGLPAWHEVWGSI